MKRLGVIEYGMGNVGSVCNMFKSIGVTAHAITNPREVADCSHLVLPGIGAFDACVGKLADAGFRSPLLDASQQPHTSILGICVGMQMLFDGSEEGNLPGLSLIPGEVRRFDFVGLQVPPPIPNMGWRSVQWQENASAGFTAERSDDRFYFVHSYHAVPDSIEHVLATSRYVYDFCCAAGRGRIWGVQFHPEKSHRFGKRFLRDWLAHG